MRKTLLFLLILSFCFYSYGQTKPGAIIKKRPTKIDRSKPSIFIDFEKIGTAAGDGKETVSLILTNNSIWSVYLGAFGSPGKYGLYHYVERDDDTTGFPKDVPRGGGRGHAGSPDLELKAGKTFRFQVPGSHLADNLKIRIDYGYEWEPELYDSPYETPRHSVYFRSSGLPRK